LLVAIPAFRFKFFKKAPFWHDTKVASVGRSLMSPKIVLFSQKLYASIWANTVPFKLVKPRIHESSETQISGFFLYLAS
jgi:hypothetical protein